MTCLPQEGLTAIVITIIWVALTTKMMDRLVLVRIASTWISVAKTAWTTSTRGWCHACLRTTVTSKAGLWYTVMELQPKWSITLTDRRMGRYLLATERSILESCWTVWRMDMVSRCGKMEANTMDSGNTTKQMAKEHLFMQTEIFTKDSGRMIKLTGMELTNMQTELHT